MGAALRLSLRSPSARDGLPEGLACCRRALPFIAIRATTERVERFDWIWQNIVEQCSDNWVENRLNLRKSTKMGAITVVSWIWQDYLGEQQSDNCVEIHLLLTKSEKID